MEECTRLVTWQVHFHNWHYWLGIFLDLHFLLRLFKFICQCLLVVRIWILWFWVLTFTSKKLLIYWVLCLPVYPHRIACFLKKELREVDWQWFTALCLDIWQQLSAWELEILIQKWLPLHWDQQVLQREPLSR